VLAAENYMPTVAGTGSTVRMENLLPLHAYTVLDCKSVPSYGKDFRLVKLRNHWGKTESNSYVSSMDKTFWEGVP
jgi:hypothetical protein